MGATAKKRTNRRKKASLIISHLVLIIIALTMLTPFIWMVLASFKSLEEVEQLRPLPSIWHPENYAQVFQQVAFARYYFNSVFVAIWVTVLTCFTSSMAAFAFSRLKWKHRDTIFKLYLGTMMIPGVVTMIPNYTLMVKLHMLDSFTGLILPAAFTAFGVFLLRQFMMSIPPALDEAATIDGASFWQIFVEIILPLSRAGIVTLAIFTFLGTYGSFYWPLILVKSQHLRTLPIGMLYFDSAYGRQTNLIMAASVMNIVPLIAIFVAGQKFLVKGIQLGAVKG
ncbi:MAG: carbohydrate ABC transporter permease [Armatimonadota bacterium]|nr:carbohydrate ABC transporter permease [bacterium]